MFKYFFNMFKKDSSTDKCVFLTGFLIGLGFTLGIAVVIMNVLHLRGRSNPLDFFMGFGTGIWGVAIIVLLMQFIKRKSV